MTPRKVFKQTWNLLTRLKVAAVLILILLLLAALGSCFPQISASLAGEAEGLARWQLVVRARYGSLTDALAAAGIFRWFRTPAFLASLGLLSMATLVCTLDRWRAVWRRALRAPAVATDIAFDAAPHNVVLTGLETAEAFPMVRKRLEQRGFRIRSKAVKDVLYLRGDRNRMAALATLVTHLAILLLLLGVVLSSGFGWREELAIGPDGTAEVRHRSRLAIRNDGFDIGRYPDGSAAAYQARVTIVQGGQQVMPGSVGVNQPLKYGDVEFFLRGYGEQDGGYSLTLLAVRDPGYGLIITAGFLLFLGLTVGLNFPRAWIQARAEPDGTLRLAGWAERRACDFGREFASLVEDMEKWKVSSSA